ncbi:XH domain-containing protein [Heracleum sosnowskyi]|uniref:XH domain-containing protein n=1 Tax=Heracleum sosnowskyi TaxID=360622 RepID=A0AAD8HK31_9APIA|nr:XH domain-containing protein [Heracleum sosnowskyi]
MCFASESSILGAELVAIREGIKWVLSIPLSNVIIETDSLMSAQAIRGCGSNLLEEDRENFSLLFHRSTKEERNIISLNLGEKYLRIEKETMEPSMFQKRMFKLTEAHKKEEDKLNLRITQLVTKLKDKQRLELEIEGMSSGVEDMIPIFEGGSGYADAEAKKEIKSLKENLKEKDELIKDLEELNKALIMKERKMNDEFQYAQNVLIDGLKDMPNSKTDIGVKRMGDVDYDWILAAAKKKYPAEEKAKEFTTLLLDKLKNIRCGWNHWHPFKKITVGKGWKEVIKEVIDEEDDFMKDIKKEWGAEVYDAVVTALTELNERHPRGRCPAPELWNFAQGGRATLGECLELILGRLKNKKRKESC